MPRRLITKPAKLPMATFLLAPALRVVVAATAAEDAAVTTREVTVVTAGDETAATTLEEVE